ncbi:complex I NDUFA9 subunit family protein [Wenzhouxiangella sp. AB-CW3]|uniref:complex I NDUFA9 subunit family protein n=1 Tax=Wenzhouxiangella sp. AB-CW3 TaxID=2771012 RepID=UPI00168B469B|nr:complex I NDUFA9 subunit family protein [Wenzhouxiangella sp. AB-CW3]QOC22328.1 complex I NDUFA9 subunit family protein [Wenzhouxiangella sp. AB-CW3]
MKILVLGGSGFVGSHLARRLDREGHELTIATRHAPRCRHLTVLPGVRVRQFDPHDVNALARELKGHDVAINLVGILNERLLGGGQGFRKAHVTLVETLIDACVRSDTPRLIHMSALNAGQGESHYLRTRGEAENMIEDAGRQGRLQTTILRPSTIFGPDDSFLNRFAGLLRISPLLPLARPDARFAPVYVGDVVEAFVQVLSRNDSAGQTYDLCGTEQWRLIDLVRWLRDQLELRRAVVGLPDALGRLQGMVFDFIPGKPFSSDNYRSLLLDSVCTKDGFAALGIRPWGMSELAPSWLGRQGRQQRYQQYRRKARRDRE